MCFLDSANRIAITDGYAVKVFPPFVQRKLETVLDPANAYRSIGVNFPDKDSYSLFYIKLDGTVGRISYNYRTGEFTHGSYPGQSFYEICTYQQDTTHARMLVGSANNLVYQLDSLSASDDGTAINRYYDTDWTECEFAGEKLLKGVTFQANKNAGGRVAISVAKDFGSTFYYEKFISLRGLPSSGTYVNVPYRIDPGLKGNVFNVRIRMFHDDGTQQEIVPPVILSYEPVSDTVGVAITEAPAARIE